MHERITNCIPMLISVLSRLFPTASTGLAAPIMALIPTCKVVHCQLLLLLSTILFLPLAVSFQSTDTLQSSQVRSVYMCMSYVQLFRPRTHKVLFYFFASVVLYNIALCNLTKLSITSMGSIFQTLRAVRVFCTLFMIIMT